MNPWAYRASWCARSSPCLPDPAHRLLRRARRRRPPRPGRRAEDDPEAVAEICRRLDGLPLAIELAAARLRLLTPRQIADRLDDRFRLLTCGSRTVLPRQQTLRAVVDWSWDLLDERRTRRCCARLSVFAGGWDLAAAEAVCTGAAPRDAPRRARRQVPGRRRPARRDGGDGMRYRLLETIHEYAAERAAERPGAARRRRAPAPRVGRAPSSRRPSRSCAPPNSSPGSPVWRPSSTTSAPPSHRALTARDEDAGRAPWSSPWAGSGGCATTAARALAWAGPDPAPGRSALAARRAAPDAPLRLATPSTRRRLPRPPRTP